MTGIKKNKLAYYFILPAIIAIALLTIYPVIYTLILSFYNYNIIFAHLKKFVGFGNYIELLSNPFFWQVMGNSVFFTVFCITVIVVLGFIVALVLNQKFIGNKFLAIVVLLPWAMPRIAATTVWKWIFNNQYGFLNYFLSSMGFSQMAQYNWFGGKISAFLSIGMVVVWKSFPFVAISYLAGFQSIPTQLFEAAEVDGANFWQKLTKITLPMLKSLTTIILILETIWVFKIFDQVYVMTEGGPAKSTYVMGIYSYMKAFGEMSMGLASAISILMFLIMLIVSILYIRKLRDKGEV